MKIVANVGNKNRVLRGDDMKIFVNKLPDTPEQCLFCIKSNDIFPSKCKLRLDNTDYDNGLIWSMRSNNNCVLYKNEPCPHLQVLYGSAS
jgi:hypothetical protein